MRKWKLFSILLIVILWLASSVPAEGACGRSGRGARGMRAHRQGFFQVRVMHRGYATQGGYGAPGNCAGGSCPAR